MYLDLGNSDMPHSPAFQAALSLLDQIGRAGLIVAPQQPTPAMIRAAQVATGVDAKTAVKVWEAMTNAS